MDMLVSTEWLAHALGQPDLRIVDATYFALDPARDAGAEYAAGHIPGAVYMNLKELKDADNPVPFMLPSAEQFARHMEALGISERDRIVLYDNSAHRTAARAWWMLTSFGAHNVAVLDGGLAKWIAEGRPLSTETPTITPRPFAARLAADAVRSCAQMIANVDNRAEQVLDARGAKRFTGAEADPRPEVASGHIPGSHNLPYDRLFDADGCWKRDATLRALFDEAGIDLDLPLVTTCGSGVTAATVLFGAALLGKRDLAIYDGSWSEWGTRPDTPKATGEA